MKPFLLKQLGAWLLPLLLLVINNNVRAQSGSGIVLKEVLDGANGSLAKDSFITVTDTAWFKPLVLEKLDTPYAVKNVVTFKINEYSNIYLPPHFSATAQVRIWYTIGGNEYSTDQDLTINYDTANAYTMRSSFVFNKAHKVRVVVLGITTNAPAAVTGALMLENEMELHPHYKWSCTENAIKTIRYIDSLTPTDSTDEVQVSWDAVTGADAYDLEWAYIDSSALQTNRYGSPINPELVFAYNTTRVTIAGNTYRIPLLYDDGGVLYCRVRAVQEKSSYTRIETAWSSDFPPDGMGAYSFVGHQRMLNWQSSIAFAEDGKRKVTIQYYDGSLRSRQTVTKDNTTDTILVTETFYDYQGRPAIQVLPSPTLSNVIRFTRNLNRDINGAEYDKDHYDYLGQPEDFPNAGAPPMDSTSGSNRYYSAANIDKNDGYNKYIPSAGGYAFTETQYTQDNTGRISKQSGVGSTFRLGSNHETKYFYGSPAEEDLYALFGTEVGDVSHYFKNMVADANGQYAVSYLDMHGRTIATALTGAPENTSLADLPEKAPLMVTDSLSGLGKNNIRDNVMELHHSLMVSEQGPYHFKYILPPPVLEKENCDGQAVKYAGLFDLEIRITDDVSNQHLPEGKAYVRDTNNYQIAGVHPDVLRDSIVLEFYINLPKGNYEITKRLVINRTAMDTYLDNYFLQSNVCTTLEKEIEKQRSVLGVVSCFPDCATCKANLGSWDDFRVKYVVTAGNDVKDTALYRTEALAAYQVVLENCKSLCNEVTATDEKRRMMLQDVTAPGGQYADPSDSAYVFSIFNTQNWTVTPPYQRDNIVYLDESGSPDMVYDESTGSMVKPQQLPPHQFAALFKPSWAEALLQFHPEYCKLQVLENYQASDLWDKRIQQVDTYKAAKDSGFLNPTNMTGVGSQFPANIIDPLSLTQKAALENRMNNYLATPDNHTYSIWSFATISTKCGLSDSQCSGLYDTRQDAFDESQLCEADRDMAWRAFRQAYLDVKQSVLQGLIPTTGCVTEHDLAKKIVRFPTPIGFLEGQGVSVSAPGSADEGIANANNKLKEQVEANCKTYVNYWIQQLGACYDTAIVRANIVPQLLDVCKAGGDLDHIMGSSTVAPGSTAAQRSFEQVLQEYNNANGIGGDVLKCNTQLITVPKPYDLQPAYVDKTAYNKPNDCECNNLGNIYKEYQALKKAEDLNFSAYLQRTRKVTLAQSNLDALLAVCGATGETCTWLSKPLIIPALIQCHVAPPCASCRDVKDLYETFKINYPGITPVIGDEDSLHLLGNQLFANYMNNHLGFSKQAWEYKAFMDSCEKLQYPGDTTVCTSPERLVKTYNNGGTDAIWDILKTPDDGYLLAGSTSSASAMSLGQDAYLIKTDKKGARQWAKMYGNSGSDDFSRVKKCTSDDGYIAIGTTYPSAHPKGATFIVKLNAQGEVTWSRMISLSTSGGERGFDIIQMSNGGYAFTGGYNYSGSNTDWLVGTLKPDGDLDWVKDLGINGPDPTVYVLEENDTLVLSGTVYSGTDAKAYDGAIVKLDAGSGDIIRGKKYQMEGRANWFSKIQRTDTSYRIAVLDANDFGSDSGTAIIVDIPKNGKATAKKLTRPPGGAIALSMAAAGNGIIVAQQGSLAPLDIYLTKIDSVGKLIWSRVSRIDGKEALGGMVQGAGGSYALSGSHDNKAMLMLPDTSGGTGCQDVDPGLLYESLAIDSSSFTAQNDLFLAKPTDFVITTVARSIAPQVIPIACNGPERCDTFVNGLLLCGNAEAVFPQVDLNTVSSCSDTSDFIIDAAINRYNNIIDSVKNDFKNSYTNLMLQAINNEQFAVTYSTSEYHYTLYYYDQAGNLVKTVPPAGVVKDRSATWINQVKAAKAAGNSLTPEHRLATQYRYNTLNQVVAQKSPDGGTTKFWYDRLGRLAVSQNAKQLINNAYSYTLYDGLGRITEVGEIANNKAMTDAISRTETSLASWINGAASAKTQITRTVYDLPEPILAQTGAFGARNLRNRVAWSAVYSNGDSLLTNGYNSGTFYSYDIHGNVDTLLQDYKYGVMANADNRWKKVFYNYDLISGKVNLVGYQAGQRDAFYHRYSYDAENRITNVETSRDSIYWENEVFYQYYKHGPLARAVIGQQQVQGLDYAYTLQGWLKGVNSTSLTPGTDMGGDGAAGARVAQDAFGFALHYFGDGDYKAINGNVSPFASATASGSGFKPLYNGNIGAMSVNLPKVGEPLFYAYGYDALNRLVSTDALKGLNTASNTWAPISVPDFGERVSYDPNGNILGYNRKGNKTWANQPEFMDSLNYHYIAGTNRLAFISDTVGVDNYNNDIDSQPTNNYKYDSIGNLIADDKENIARIEWTVYGKISKITKKDSSTISYTYDAAGNRIAKTVAGVTTWYVRDATGNVMSVYTHGKSTVNDGALSQTEVNLYGSNRLGISTLVTDMEVADAPLIPLMEEDSARIVNFIRGNKFFELSNHLGNVLATVADTKQGVSVNGTTVDHYEADVASANDYYPFGMLQPGRSWNIGNYRYGFNGKENDNEIKGEGNQQDYGMRVYDGRVGRFLSVDPLMRGFPMLTPYQYASNNPILNIDIDGKEGVSGITVFAMASARSKNGTPTAADIASATIDYAKIHLNEMFDGVSEWWERKKAAYTGVGPGLQDYITAEVNPDIHNEYVPKKTAEIVTRQRQIAGLTKAVNGVAEMYSDANTIILAFSPTDETYFIGDAIKSSLTAREYAYAYAADYMKTTSKKKMARAVTAIHDIKTGKVYYGISGTLEEATISNELRSLFPSKNLEEFPLGNCAECDALQQALADKANMKNLRMHTVQIEKKTGKVSDFKRCDNCLIMSRDIKVTSDPK